MSPNFPNMKTYADLLADTENTWDYPDDEDSYIDPRYVDGEEVEYEIIFGNDKIVFIKAGAGGSVRGHENKYLKMARRVHERLGATVICASNPDVPHEDVDESEIRWVIAEKGFFDFEISFVGASDGAYRNLSLVGRFPEAVKWLGINTSYIELSEFGARLNALPSVSKTLIYGTKDDEIDEVVPALSKLENDKLKVVLVEGADHSFTGMLDEFVASIDNLC